jgi:hypothetical protein
MLLVLGTAEIFTPIIEAAAVAIASGVVLGGFGGASAGVLNSWSRKQVEGDALRDGHIGATFAFCLWLLDQCIVYATSI